VMAFLFAVVGALVGASSFSFIRGTWRSIHRRRIQARCREARRSREAMGQSNAHVVLSDLDQIASMHPAFRDLGLALLTAMSTRSRTLRLNALGNVSRVQLQGEGPAMELAPLAIHFQELLRWMLAGEVPSSSVFEKMRRWPMEMRESRVDVAVSIAGAEEGAAITLYLPSSGALAEEATGLLREYQEFFVGDPWSPEPIPVPLRRLTETNGAPNADDEHAAHERGTALLRLTFKSPSPVWRAGESVPVWATLDAVPAAHGTYCDGFDQVVETLPGNHLLQLFFQHPRPKSLFLADGNGHKVLASPQFLLCVADPGVYTVNLSMWHFQRGIDARPPVLKQLGGK
jgi:hypothetical protein